MLKAQLEQQKASFERKGETRPEDIDITKLPDYMTLRRRRIQAKRVGKVKYTLELTNAMPKPDYKNAKSRINDSNMPDDVEESMQKQVKFMQEMNDLKDNSFLQSLKKMHGLQYYERLKPILARH